MFTCHEHLARLIKSRNIDVRCLPEHGMGGSDVPFEIDFEQSPRRVRTRRVKNPEPFVPVVETPAISPVQQDVVPAIPHLPEPELRETVPTTVIAVERPVVPMLTPQRMRIDPPEAALRLSPIRRRWNAEEFRGELDDQVNPAWSSGLAPTRQPNGIAVVRTPASLIAPPSAGMAAAKAKMLQLFDGDSNALVDAILPGDEDWEL
jgi:hypothetical protein